MTTIAITRAAPACPEPPASRTALDLHRTPGPARLPDAEGPPAVAHEALGDRQLLERFVNLQDSAAFGALVQRHGPMVLGVCRRVLRDAHAAEDACQAVFLVLLRRAASIARPELLSGWLYGVAMRVAGKARAGTVRRRAHEKRATSPAVPDPVVEAARRDLRSVLTAEIERLPEKYRDPLILCYWEGKTNDEAARQLGCPPGSMSYRLARGREMLRERLSCGAAPT
jgi:RNA polymerase sigma factor (sigma-70 family)